MAHQQHNPEQQSQYTLSAIALMTDVLIYANQTAAPHIHHILGSKQ